MEDIYNYIEDLELSQLTYKALKRAGVNLINDLCNMTENEVLDIRQISKKRLLEIKNALADISLKLK